MKKTIAVILLAAIVIGGVCGIISYNGPESVAKRYMKAELTLDYKSLVKLTAYDWYAWELGSSEEEDFFNRESNIYDEDITSWEEYFDAANAVFQEFCFMHGEPKFSFEVTKIRDITVRRLKLNYSDILDEYEEESLLDADKISAAKEATVRGKIETEEGGIERETYIVVLVKISGTWKVLTYDYK